MSETICFSKNYLLIIFCVFLGLAVWYIHYEKKKHIMEKDYKFNDSMIMQVQKIINNPDVERREYLNERDRRVLYDDLSPPERRVPEYIYPYNHVKKDINIPTRGYPENYNMVGVLLRDNTETAYNLFGRQTYPGSNIWEYYAQRTEKDNDVKLPVGVRGNKEIMDNDNIMIPGTDPKKGHFNVRLYKYDVPRYIPIL